MWTPDVDDWSSEIEGDWVGLFRHVTVDSY